MAPEQTQEPALLGQQPLHHLPIGRPPAGVDRTETGVLHPSAQASRPKTGGLPCLTVEQIGLQPAQPAAGDADLTLAMETPGFDQGLTAEIQAHHIEAQARQPSRFMAPTAAWSEETGNGGAALPSSQPSLPCW